MATDTALNVIGNFSSVSPGSATAQAAGSSGLFPNILLLLPFIALVLLIIWGSKKRGRKQRTIELGYNLIAIEALLLLLLPACHQIFSCGFWGIVPVAMFLALVLFIYHRRAMEAQHRAIVARAVTEGHVKPHALLQNKLEEDMKPGAPKKPLHHHIKSKIKSIKHRVARKKKEEQKPSPQPQAAAPATRKHWLAKYAEGLSSSRASAHAHKEAPSTARLESQSKSEVSSAKASALLPPPAPTKPKQPPVWLVRRIEAERQLASSQKPQPPGSREQPPAAKPAQPPAAKTAQPPLSERKYAISPGQKGPRDSEKNAVDSIMQSVLRKESKENQST